MDRPTDAINDALADNIDPEAAVTVKAYIEELEAKATPAGVLQQWMDYMPDLIEIELSRLDHLSLMAVEADCHTMIAAVMFIVRGRMQAAMQTEAAATPA